LRLAALVAPDDGWAYNFVSGIEQNGTVHLSGKADTSNIARLQARRLKSVAHRDSASFPPIVRILFSPAGARAGKILVLG
jgi:hypothetical protein